MTVLYAWPVFTKSGKDVALLDRRRGRYHAAELTNATRLTHRENAQVGQQPAGHIA